MQITAIICEYNPFHNGHAYQIKQARESGATHVLCLMSGDFVQRGDVALLPRHLRAKAALRCGADLVIQLPTIYAMSRAERFAYGAVSILDALGCVDTLHFGSECADLSLLSETARAVIDPAVITKTKQLMGEGVSFAAARQKSVANLYSQEHGMLLSRPNDTLAIEYLKWLIRLNSSIVPQTIKRTGTDYHSETANGIFASASHLRTLCLKNPDSLQTYVPSAAMKIYQHANACGLLGATLDSIDSAVMYTLRGMSPFALSSVADVSEGLEHRIFDTVHKTTTLQHCLQSLATKRYPDARLRRILLSACLGILESDAHTVPQGAKILGMNTKGREILSHLNLKAHFDLRSKSGDLERSSAWCKRMVEIEFKAQGLYALACPVPTDSLGEYTTPPIILT